MTIGITCGLSPFFLETMGEPDLETRKGALEWTAMLINMRLVELTPPADLPEDAIFEYVDPTPFPEVFGERGIGRAWGDAYPASMLLKTFDVAQERAGCHVPPGDVCQGMMVFLPFDVPVLLTDEEIFNFDDTPFCLWAGSAVRLMHDLVYVAPRLGIHLEAGRLTDEGMEQLDDSDSENGHEGWLLLYEAARLAIAHRFAFVLSG